MSAYVGSSKNLKDLKDPRARPPFSRSPRAFWLRMYLLWSNSHAPLEDHPLDPRHAPSPLEGWILEILCCDPKGNRAFLQTLLWEGEDVGRNLNLKDLKDTNLHYYP